MKAKDLVVGKLYMLTGGMLMRYQGPHSGCGPCLAFRPPSDGVSLPPVGYSAAPSRVLQQLSKKDLEWLRSRQAQCAKSAVLADSFAEVTLVINELEGAAE